MSGRAGGDDVAHGAMLVIEASNPGSGTAEEPSSFVALATLAGEVVEVE